MGYIEAYESKSGIKVIEEDYIPKEYVIGRKYHCSWAKNRGFVWRLKAIEGNIAVLITPRTKRELRTKLDSLRELNNQVYKNASKRVKHEHKSQISKDI